MMNSGEEEEKNEGPDEIPDSPPNIDDPTADEDVDDIPSKTGDNINKPIGNQFSAMRDLVRYSTKYKNYFQKLDQLTILAKKELDNHDSTVEYSPQGPDKVIELENQLATKDDEVQNMKDGYEKEILALQEKAESLQREVDQLNTENERRDKDRDRDNDNIKRRLDRTEHELRDTKRELDSTESRLRRQERDNKSHYESRISNLQQEFRELETRKKDLERENDVLKADINNLKQRAEVGENRSYEFDEKQRRSGMETCEIEVEETKTGLSSRPHKKKKHSDTKTSKHDQDTQELEARKAELELENERLKKEIESLKMGQNTDGKRKSPVDEIDAAQRQQIQTDTVSPEIESESKDTTTGIGNRNGEELTENTTNNVDAIDTDRTSILIERYKELYENQWSNAFEILEETEGDEENKIFSILLTILTQTKEFCDKESQQQMEDIQKVITHSDKVRQRGVPDVVLKYVKACRIDSPAESIRAVYKKYRSWLKTGSPVVSRYAMSVKDYTKECFEICWLMAIQDPPVAFASEPENGETIKFDMYDKYSVNGPNVDFLVLPAMLQHADGPVIAKGVVQATTESVPGTPAKEINTKKKKHTKYDVEQIRPVQKIRSANSRRKQGDEWNEDDDNSVTNYNSHNSEISYDEDNYAHRGKKNRYTKRGEEQNRPVQKMRSANSRRERGDELNDDDDNIDDNVSVTKNNSHNSEISYDRDAYAHGGKKNKHTKREEEEIRPVQTGRSAYSRWKRGDERNEEDDDVSVTKSTSHHSEILYDEDGFAYGGSSKYEERDLRLEKFAESHHTRGYSQTSTTTQMTTPTHIPCTLDKYDSYTPHRTPYTPSITIVTRFLHWKRKFGDETARRMMGSEYDKIENYFRKT